MKNFFRFSLFAALCAIFSVLVLSCKNESDDEPASDAASYEAGIIVFYPPDGLGDNSYVDSFCFGVQKSALKHNLAVYDICPDDWEDAKSFVDDFVQVYYEFAEEDDTPMLFVFADAGYLAYITPYLASKPDTISFLQFDAKESEYGALHTVYMPLYGASYLAGAAAKELLSEKQNPRVLNLLANDSSEPLKDALNGFASGYGARWNGTVYSASAEWTAEESEQFNAQDFAALSLSNANDESGYDSAELAYALVLGTELLNLYDLYFPVCGGSVHGLLRYNREKGADSFYTVGMDTDLSVYTAQVPFSVVKHMDRAIETCVGKWLSGSLPHHQNLTLADGYTGLVISKPYAETLSALMQDATQTAIEKEREYEENK